MTTCDELYDNCSPAEGGPTFIEGSLVLSTERAEVCRWETVDVLAEQYDEQYNHGDTPAEGCGDGGAFHAQFRKAEAAEDEE